MNVVECYEPKIITIMMNFMIDQKAVSKNLTSIIKKFIHKELTVKLNCVKQQNGKYTLKPSGFYECLRDISEKNLDKLRSTILANSRDWNHRCRKTQDKEKNSE
ncbi:hypothetical protein P5V15_003570 [Pogonomyrmex californicus]